MKTKTIQLRGRAPVEPSLISRPVWRQQLAGGLRRSGSGLLRLAERLTSQGRRRTVPELEFYAEAGAPEGALYQDGQLVGLLPGVTRL
ncbi:MAG: hypothetical protein ACK4S6_19845 [Roseateles asaccharophilus]|jgi:hypothetical protein|uniref:Uncharacterized protein n=1 Tax=Roseateles asaccharophilus TaxID=582607 RepID=A0A4R6MSK6_9BURK|nr:hypothetical protein [Roseateles asaccharophilus]MDN3546330.1 hypothetical protein [Roseateles asaccharophilus]TDP04957.1 hypothetical protein DFR39_11370 [Roseateles asaccharophilus]